MHSVFRSNTAGIGRIKVFRSGPSSGCGINTGTSDDIPGPGHAFCTAGRCTAGQSVAGETCSDAEHRSNVE